ncbi:Angiotensin-converting enzyme [Halotydeus destructor]|nr:Angiotensin-converting enzyme [Halotydeus destructor]
MFPLKLLNCPKPSIGKYSKRIRRFKYENFTDAKLRRMFELKSKLGPAAVGVEKSANFKETINRMNAIYSTAKICVTKGDNETCGLPLDPDLTTIFEQERDWDVLAEIWTDWRNATGRQVRSLYSRYVELGNEVAEKNDLEDYGAYWRYFWEDDQLEDKLAALWDEIRPLYVKLHAYVRKRLGPVYGDRMPTDGTLPAHIVGDMWAQNWAKLADIVMPFNGTAKFDVTDEMIRQNYTVRQLFELSESFYTSLGLDPMTETFWNKSMVVRPTDGREVVCHASAWDMEAPGDFRIKQCTRITQEDLFVTHHEMGHVEYFMMYSCQPYVFKSGANAGFHEAVGDLMALSVSSPPNLVRIGLLRNYTDDEQSTVNHQMFRALNDIAFLPYGYIVDLWRYQVFAGNVSESEWNRKWWDLRIKYQGVSPPVNRSEVDFDSGAKFHVVADVPYIRYFVARLLTFQFHEALCTIANQSERLDQCNIFGNREVGRKIRDVLSQGRSVPWHEQLQQFTGNANMSAQPLLRYFKPLSDFLDKELEEEIASGKLGWDSAKVDNYFSPDAVE